MPACNVCGSESFDVLDSLYFCGECGTQSQDFRDEQAEEDQGNVFSKRLAVVTSSALKDKNAEEAEKGKPWLSHEAFQCILKAQVEALINMGFCPKLKDIVGQLWFSYLARTNVAFTGSHNKNKINSAACTRNARDTNLLKGSKKQTGLSLMHNRFRVKKKPKNEDSDDELELSSHLSSVTDDKEQESVPRTDEDSGSEDDGKLLTQCALDPDDIPHIGSRCVMRLKSTLFFCYLGLRWLNEPVGLGDLIRWANAGCLPFHDGVQYLPPHMRLRDRDALVFNFLKCLVLQHGTWLMFSSLSGFLELPEFPVVDYSLFVCRYIIDLHLPDCVHRIVKALMDKYKLELFSLFNGPGTKCIQYIEERAMSLVIIAMKLLYGLDGKTERELESKVEVFGSDIPSKSSNYIYSWDDWVLFIRQWQSDLMKAGIPQDLNDLKYLRNTRNYGTHCLENVFGRWTVPTQKSKYSGRTRIAFMSHKNEEYAHVFHDIVQQGDDGPQESGTGTFVRQPICSDRLQECIARMKSRGIPLAKLHSNKISMEDDVTFSSENVCARLLHVTVPKNLSELDFDSLPKSFTFVVVTCAKMIQCNPTWLVKVLSRIEHSMFFLKTK